MAFHTYIPRHSSLVLQHLIFHFFHGYFSTENGSHSQVTAMERITGCHHIPRAEHLQKTGMLPFNALYYIYVQYAKSKASRRSKARKSNYFERNPIMNTLSKKEQRLTTEITVRRYGWSIIFKKIHIESQNFSLNEFFT